MWHFNAAERNLILNLLTTYWLPPMCSPIGISETFPMITPDGQQFCQLVSTFLPDHQIYGHHPIQCSPQPYFWAAGVMGTFLVKFSQLQLAWTGSNLCPKARAVNRTCPEERTRTRTGLNLRFSSLVQGSNWGSVPYFSSPTLEGEEQGEGWEVTRLNTTEMREWAKLECHSPLLWLKIPRTCSLDDNCGPWGCGCCHV